MKQTKSKIVYNKLVRDKIPEIIEKEGKTPKITIIQDLDEYHHALALKIVEEGKEYLETKDVREIVDILEVIDALLEIHGLSFDNIRLLKQKKKEQRGAFEKRIKLVSVSSYS